MMMPASLSELAASIPGTLLGDARFDRISTDTRNIQPGDLFVALSGERFNGNRFAKQAYDLGAAAVVVSEEQALAIPQLIVEDTRLALGLIAGCQRKAFVGPLIALTGSAGKTSTKEMVAAILSECGEVLATQGNFNNEIGVPLTLLNLQPSHQYAVIEMGAAKPGDIAYLCQFAKPSIALVTNAKPAHMLGFDSVEAVAKTKGGIFESLAPSGFAVINLDDPFVKTWQQQAAHAQSKTFSLSSTQADVYAKNIHLQGRDGVTFVLCAGGEEVLICLSLLGEHNVSNALAASAVALLAGASLAQIQRGLSQVKPVSGRLNMINVDDQLTIIDDSYNANPEAVKAAIDVLSTFDGERCLVLGDMAELGRDAQAMHFDVGQYAGEKKIKQLVAMGPSAKAVAQGFGEGAVVCDSIDAVIAHCQLQCSQGVVLVKGSRSAGMERVVLGLTSGSIDDSVCGGLH